MGVPPDHPSQLILKFMVTWCDLGSPSLGHLHIYDKPMGFSSTTHLGTGMHPTPKNPTPSSSWRPAHGRRVRPGLWAIGFSRLGWHRNISTWGSRDYGNLGLMKISFNPFGFDMVWFSSHNIPQLIISHAGGSKCFCLSTSHLRWFFKLKDAPKR